MRDDIEAWLASPVAAAYDDRNPPPGSPEDYGLGEALELPDIPDDIGEKPAALPLIDPAEWQGRAVPPREWMLDEWLPLRQATYLTGPGSAGKSLLSQQLATCISLGLPFLGQRTREAPAFYITCEDDADELHRRQDAICQALNITLSSLRGRLRLSSLMGETSNYLATFDQDGRLRIEPRFHQIEAALAQHPGAFVALDNVAHMTGDEIRRSSVAGFVNLLNRIALNTGGAVLFLGHPNKKGDDYSGSTAWENQVRSRLLIETPQDEDGQIADRDVRILSRAKANYARNGEQIVFRWHRWAFVRDEDLPKNVGAELAAAVQARNEEAAFMACLAERNKQRRPVSERRGPTYAPSQFARMKEAKGLNKNRLETAMDRLFATGRIKRDFVMRDTEKRRDIHGIVEVKTGAPEAPQTVAPNGPTTLRPNTPQTLVQTLPTHTVGTTYHKGAPSSEVGAPSGSDSATADDPP